MGFVPIAAMRFTSSQVEIDVYNRTPLHLEEKICTLGRQMPEMGTRELSWRIESITGENMVYRILKRKEIRYTRDTEYARRKKLKRYCLEVAGQEV